MDEAIDCGCVIHGDLYSWDYVVRLRNMICRYMDRPVKFHVFTEPERSVPSDMIRHDLRVWPGISGRRRAWWYKMQMFDPRHQLGPFLYMDLDVVIVRSLSWILDLDTRYFWSVRDFRRLWRPTWQVANTSLMYWDASQWSEIWQDFAARDINTTVKQWPGDQDYITHIVGANRLKFVPQDMVQSWRWQIQDGGMDFRNRTYRRPGTGSVIPPEVSVIVFHGNPKPHDTHDSVIHQLWT